LVWGTRMAAAAVKTTRAIRTRLNTGDRNRNHYRNDEYSENKIFHNISP
jgi:hypothetical protein